MRVWCILHMVEVCDLLSPRQSRFVVKKDKPAVILAQIAWVLYYMLWIGTFTGQRLYNYMCAEMCSTCDLSRWVAASMCWCLDHTLNMPAVHTTGIQLIDIGLFTYLMCAQRLN
jgi:hypothetical protein